MGGSWNSPPQGGPAHTQARHTNLKHVACRLKSKPQPPCGEATMPTAALAGHSNIYLSGGGGGCLISLVMPGHGVLLAKGHQFKLSNAAWNLKKWLWMKGGNSDRSALQVPNTKLSNFGGQLRKSILWPPPTVMNRRSPRGLASHGDAEWEEDWEIMGEERGRDEGREAEERKNGPILGFRLETLITQDHRLWQSNLLGCCLKNNHKRLGATCTNTQVCGERWG